LSEHVLRVEGAKALDKKTIYPYELKDMVRLGEHTSMAERRADDATRDVVGWLKCEYLQDHIGDTFAGVITAVTNFGVFVEILDVYVEGLIHITSLPSDYYRYEEAHHRLVGERTRQMFCLGDEVSVQVAAVKLDDRKVDFELAGVDPSNTGKKTSRRKSTNKAKDSEREKIRRGQFAAVGVKKSSAKKTASKKKAVKKTGVTAKYKKTPVKDEADHSVKKSSKTKSTLVKSTPVKSALEKSKAKKIIVIKKR
jgi:ribonuclease R